MAKQTPTTTSHRSWSRRLTLRSRLMIGFPYGSTKASASKARKSLDSGDTLVTEPPTSDDKGPASSSEARPSAAPVQYESKGVQADLPPLPRAAPAPAERGTGQRASARPPDALPPLEHYSGAYPQLNFPPSLTLPHWELPSGKPPEVVSDRALNTFHPFSRLPAELRVRIWRLHLERPRIVRISTIDFVKKLHFTPNSLGKLASNIQWYTTNRLPSLMRVCSESRAETLAFYRVHLSLEQRQFYFAPVYINPEWDVLVMNCTHDAFPMDIFLSDVMAYDPKSVGVVHLGSYLEPGKWDCDPVQGCAALSVSAKNLRSFTECQYAGTSSRMDVFPILRIGEGYCLESVDMDAEKFARFLPRHSRNLQRDNPKHVIEQLKKILPKGVAEGLDLQTLYVRTHSRVDPPPRSLATGERGAGLVLWNRDETKDGRYMYFSVN